MSSSRLYPALDVLWPLRPDDERVEIFLAEIDEEHPIGVEELVTGLRIYFANPTERGRAAVRLVALEPDLTCEPLEVEDGDWAARSQASLEPVKVGRLIVAPPWRAADLERDAGHNAGGEAPPRTGDADSSTVILIQPSMGFGTGHHASTRLCLQLLQQLPVAGLDVLDVGTGSGVLAIAAARLGARAVVAIDHDTDALAAARDNVVLNDAGERIELIHADLDAVAGLCRERHPGTEAFDLVLANLTGAALARNAHVLAALVRPKGALVASGFQSEEIPSVTAALQSAGLAPAAPTEEDGWVAGVFLRFS